MRRHTPLKRGGRLSPTSKKRLADLGRRRAVREAVFVRDGGCVVAGLWGPCHGDLTAHHLLKASQGGTYEMTNLVALCAHHNTKVEDRPKEAEALGLVRRPLPQESIADGPSSPLASAVARTATARDLLGEFLREKAECENCQWWGWVTVRDGFFRCPHCEHLNREDQ